MDYQTLCMDVVELARQVGMFIKVEELKVKKADVEEKSLNSLVSYVDKEAERMLVESLGKLLPDAGFIAEEGTSDKVGEEYNWIIDPLDGTTNFLSGIPVYSVSIALERRVAKNEGRDTLSHTHSQPNSDSNLHPHILIGVVYEVNHDECFYSWEGGGAYLNNEVMSVSKEQEVKNSLLATGFPYYDYERMDSYFEVLKHFAQNSRGVRRMGSAAVDLAYVACGRFEAFFEYSLNPWDVAAGAFLVEQAGGKVSDFKGGHNWLHGKEMLASSANTFDQVLKVVSGI